MVYKLYELSYDEVKVVQPEFEMSMEEYEKFSIDGEFVNGEIERIEKEMNIKKELYTQKFDVIYSANKDWKELKKDVELHGREFERSNIPLPLDNLLKNVLENKPKTSEVLLKTVGFNKKFCEIMEKDILEIMNK
jgi:predicted nuclease with TOPRIM domain